MESSEGRTDRAENVAAEARELSRRRFLVTAASTGAALALPAGAAADAARRPARHAPVRDRATRRLFRELDEKILRAMDRHGVPGAAVGVFHRGRQHLRGLGVTNVDYPVAVDADTVFRVGSTSKTFTGTAAMCLVDRGKLDLDRPVRDYLPAFRTEDPTAGARTTVRQALNHSAGWLGDDFENTGAGDDALARYVAGMAGLPQLTPPGSVFSYSNSALSLAGRLIEVAAGTTYEHAVRSLVLDPLELEHSRFFSDEIIGFNIAAPHVPRDGKQVVDPAAWTLERAGNPNGGLISSARDQLRFARFHLGDGRGPSRKRVMSRRSLVAMRSHPGPGGTLIVELDGMGVSWMLRPTAERVRVVQHGGDVPGYHSGFMLVPSRGFALTVLTNSEGGTKLLNELFADDWALRRFVGLRNLPATPHRRARRELAPYEGRYTAQELGPDGKFTPKELELRADRGGLRVSKDGHVVFRLAFYKHDHVLQLDHDGTPTGLRADFIRGGDGRIMWLRIGGRLCRHD